MTISWLFRSFVVARKSLLVLGDEIVVNSPPDKNRTIPGLFPVLGQFTELSSKPSYAMKTLRKTVVEAMTDTNNVKGITRTVMTGFR